MTERSDWKVWATLNRAAILADLAHLVGLLRMRNLYCVVSAADEDEAKAEAEKHLAIVMQVPKKYLAKLAPRRLRRNEELQKSGC